MLLHDRYAIIGVFQKSKGVTPIAIRIITDSTSDITQAMAGELGIDVLPLTVSFGNDDYTDGVTITLSEFYNKLREAKQPPKSTQVNPEAFRAVFERHAANGDSVVCLFIASKLSGTYQSACIAKEECGDADIYIIDSENTTLALKLLVLESIRMRDEGKTAAEIAGTIRSIVPRLMICAAIDTLKYLVMGGRLSTVSGAMGQLMGIKPLIEVTGGIIEVKKKARGTKKAHQAVVEMAIENGIDTAYSVILGHTDCPEELVTFKAQFEQLSGIADALTSDIGVTVGTHAGPGCVGIAFIKRTSL